MVAEPAATVTETVSPLRGTGVRSIGGGRLHTGAAPAHGAHRSPEQHEFRVAGWAILLAWVGLSPRRVPGIEIGRGGRHVVDFRVFRGVSGWGSCVRVAGVAAQTPWSGFGGCPSIAPNRLAAPGETSVQPACWEAVDSAPWAVWRGGCICGAIVTTVHQGRSA